MGTTFKEVNDMFLSKTTDDLYVTLTEAQTKADLFKFMQTAFALFKYPKVDITDIDEVLEEFNVTLNYDEINIITELMKLSWLERQIYDIRVTKMSYTDKDFQKTSQAYHLAKLLDALELQQKKIVKLQNNYSKKHRTEKRASFSGLAGDGRR